ncbi:MAG: succinate dehydrogenase cytochrome b subunit [Acidimicrobiia bacterium]
MTQTLERPGAGEPAGAAPTRHAPWPVRFYRSAVGKKWVMAVTGIVLLGFVLVHMIGNLKLFLGTHHGRHAIDVYGEWLRTLGEPALPRTVLLWIVRLVLISAFVLHIHSALTLTRMNHRARPMKYQSKRDYVAANFASRTMRYSGVIVGLFLIYHLMDLTWGVGGADFTRGHVYDNLVNSFQRPPVAIVYIAAMVVLAVHIFHGAWSMFQSLGWNNPRYNAARLWFARGFALLILVGNVSMPIAVMTGAVK